jgi:ATP-dependent DNA helicase DinG
MTKIEPDGMRQTPRSLNLPKKFKFWRDGQYEAIEAVTQSQKPVFLLDSPTGTGKSIIGIGSYSKLARVHATLEKLQGEESTRRRRCVYVTRTKQLQDQILKEFPMARAVKGRSNYPCLLRENDFPEFTADDCQGTDSCRHADACPYRLAKSAALTAPVAVLNDAYFLGEAAGPGMFSRSTLLVLDEVDSLENSLMTFIQLSLSAKQLKRMKLKPPAQLSDAMAWVAWAGKAQFDIERQKEGLSQQLTLPVEQWSDIELDMQKAHKRLDTFGTKLALFSELVNNINWIFSLEENGEEWKVVFKPITVAPYAERYLWRHAERALGMSGSIFDPEILANDMGIEEWDYLRMDSPFPVENRPIFFRPVASMTHKKLWEELPKLTDEIIRILEKHATDRVLIHTVSYKIRDYLMSHLPEQRLITHTSLDRESILNQFRTSTDPLVLVSPSFDRGVDLPQESCRAIIIAKMPYLDLSDRQVKARMDQPGGQRWYNVKTAQTLVQMAGRGVRSKDDYCDTYILDRQFQRLHALTQNILPKWWLEAIQWQSTEVI